MEKVLEAILNMQILDEKDEEKIRCQFNKSVTMRDMDENTAHYNEESVHNLAHLTGDRK